MISINWRISLIWIFGISLAISAVGQESTAKPLDIDNGIVCRINTEAISKRDVEGRMGAVGDLLRKRRAEWEATGQWNADVEKKWNDEYIPEFRNALRRVVRDRMMLQAAQEGKLTIDQKALEKKCQSELKRLRSMDPKLAKIYTASDIQTAVREQMLINAFRSKFCSILEQPIRREVEKYYKENLNRYQRPAGVKIRIIRIDRFVINNLTRPPTQKLRENSYELAEELRKDIDEYGGSFSEMARKHSDDPESRAREGLIRLNNKDDFIDAAAYSPQLAKAIRGLPVKKVSQVFEFGQSSWAIAWVEERREAGAIPLEGELYEQIYETLFELKARKKEDEWFRKALSKNLVDHVVEGVSKPLPIEFFFPDENKE
ncbi:MAG: peptidylprolyl isomerase [Planctomycetota bacterium]